MKRIALGGRGGGSSATEQDRDERKLVFLDSMRDGNSPTESARKAGIGHSTAYNWRNADAEFAAQWDSAKEQGTDGLEDEAIRRAKDGSDVLLMFMLKARRPEIYANLHGTVIKHVGHDGGTIKHETVDDTRPTLDALFAEYRELFPEQITHEEK